MVHVREIICIVLLSRSFALFPHLSFLTVKYNDELQKLMMFTFPSHECIQVTSDESDLAFEIMSQIFKSFGNMSFTSGVNMDLKCCKGFVLISKHIKQAISLLEKVPLYYENRLLILIISEGTHRHFETFIYNASKWLGDSEVLLTMLGKPSRHFIRQQPNENFQDLRSIHGLWNKELYGVQDFRGRTVKVGTFNCSVFSSFDALDENGSPSWFGGTELILVKESFDRLNLKLNIVMPTTSDLWGQYDGMDWRDGIMGLLAAGEVDLVFCGLWIVPSMIWCKLETSYPTAEGCLKLIVPKPKYLNSGWCSLFNPFTVEMWVFTGVSVILAAVLLFWTSTLVRTYGPKESSPSSTHGVTIVGSIFLAVSLFLAAGDGESSIKPIRQVVIWWITLGFILTTCYSSGLITQLTSPRLSVKMDTIQQLVENDFVWTSPYALDVQLMLDLDVRVGSKLLKDAWESTWARRMTVIPDQQQEWETVASSKVALFGQQYGKEAFTLDSDYPADLLKQFEITRDCINTYKIGLVLRPGSPYFRPLGNYILRYHSGGLVNKIMNDQFEKIAMQKPYVREVFDTMKKTVKAGEKLNIDNLKGAFLLLIIGLIGSLLVFLLEVLIMENIKLPIRKRRKNDLLYQNT